MPPLTDATVRPGLAVQQRCGDATGGHWGRRRYFALRMEPLALLLGLPATRVGDELLLVCHPLYGRVEILLGDLAGGAGSWLEVRAAYAADWEKAHIRVDRALHPFELVGADRRGYQ